MKKTCPHNRAGWIAALILLALTHALPAQWLTHSYLTNNPPSNQSTTAFFPNAPANYGGNVTVTATNFVDGTADGIVGIVPMSYTTVTSAFTNLFPLNSGTTFETLNMGSTDTGDTFSVTFDFSNLANGYLPVGAIMGFVDLDSLERINGLVAFDANGNQITGSWLQTLAPPGDYFDWAGYGITPGNQATSSLSNGIYTFTAPGGNDTSSFQGFTTQVNIKSFSFTYDHNQGTVGDAPGGYGIGILAPVPEPGTSTLVICGCLTALAVYCRKAKRSSRSIVIS